MNDTKTMNPHRDAKGHYISIDPNKHGELSPILKKSERKRTRKFLTKREILFCEYILQGIPMNHAYIKAGYKGASPSAVRSEASRLAACPLLKAYREREMKRTLDLLFVDRMAIKKRMLEIGYGLVDEEVVTMANVGEDDRGKPVYEAVVVKKKVGARDQIAALTYLDKDAKELEESINTERGELQEFIAGVDKKAGAPAKIDDLKDGTLR